MKPSQLMKVLPSYLKRRRPVMLWGPPGAGKSDLVNQLGVAMGGIPVIDFRLAMRDPTALMGFPMPNHEEKVMHFYKDTQLPTSGQGILFLDEINSAPQATQAAGMQLTLTGQIGEYVLPEGWSIMAAGNRETDRSVVHRMPAALSLRLTHFDFEISLEDWVQWAMTHNIDPDVIGFIRFRPGLLHDFDPQARSSPNPRGWAFVDEVYKDNLDPADLFEAVKGTVGEAAATEFHAFVGMVRHLPTPEQILLAPKKVEVPTDAPAKLFALATACAQHVREDTMDTMMEYITRMPTEFQVLFARDATSKDQSVCETESFQQWSLKNSRVMTGT